MCLFGAYAKGLKRFIIALMIVLFPYTLEFILSPLFVPIVSPSNMNSLLSLFFRRQELGLSTICIVDVHWPLLTKFLLIEFNN